MTTTTGRRLLGNPWVGTVFRAVLAAILLYAGTVKLFEPGGARDAIVAYRIFPGDWPTLLGWALPVAEVLLGLLLLVGLFVRWAAAATFVLMVAFVAGIASVWARGYNIDCGCFGSGGDITDEGKAWRYTSEILRDLLFAGMAAWLVAWPRTRLALEAAPRGTTYGDPSDHGTDDEHDDHESGARAR
ncbi:MAG: DoxX family membrane protein [Candidatus Nanopelagicales bacterium]